MLQKLKLFNDFIQHWQDIVGGEAIVISSQGEVVANSNGLPLFDWQEILSRASPNQASVLDFSSFPPGVLL